MSSARASILEGLESILVGNLENPEVLAAGRDFVTI